MLGEAERSVLAERARSLGLEPAALEAVVMVESGGRIFAKVGGRNEPLIRFEGHYFDRLIRPPLRAEARVLGLASPRAEVIANPPGQAERWQMLARAAGLDQDAAYQSVSWGIGQVMGAHWKVLGYESVDHLVAEARSGFEGQLRLMLAFIKQAGLMPALTSLDWRAFARGYNGPGFARHGYDRKLEAAYLRAGGSQAGAILKSGMRGQAVAALQARLAGLGHRLAADGVFGPETERAVRMFQESRRLQVDGMVGPATRAALDHASEPSEKPTHGMAARLAAFLRRLLSL